MRATSITDSSSINCSSCCNVNGSADINEDANINDIQKSGGQQFCGCEMTEVDSKKTLHGIELNKRNFILNHKIR